MGVNKFDIIVSDAVINTLDEAIQVKEILSRESKLYSLNKIILVTSAFHMSRAKYLFEEQGIKTIPFPVDFKREEITMLQIISNPTSWIPSSKEYKYF